MEPNYVGFTTSSRHNLMRAPEKHFSPSRLRRRDVGERGSKKGDLCVHTAQTLVLHNCHTNGAETHRQTRIYYGEEKKKKENYTQQRTS